MEINILDYIYQNLHSPFLDRIMLFFTWIGNGGAIWIIIAVIALFFRKYHRLSFELVVSLLLSVLVFTVLKNIIQRPRPFTLRPELTLLIEAPTDYSFPSGHAMTSFASATVLFLANRRLGIAGFIVAFLIAFSRMYLYVHYLTDVLAGALLGILVGIIVHRLTDILIRRMQKPDALH